MPTSIVTAFTPQCGGSGGDLGAILASRPPAGADLIIAADTLVYLDDLRPIVASVASALVSGGLFVFTAEAGETAFALGAALRFQHSEARLQEAAAGAGLTVARLVAAATRREAGLEVPGRAGVLAKP